MCLIDSALQISSTIKGSISAAVSAWRCTNIQEELKDAADIQERDGKLAELHFRLTGWMYKCKIFFPIPVHITESLCILLLEHAPVTKECT